MPVYTAISYIPLQSSLLHINCPISGKEVGHQQGVVGTLGSQIQGLKGRGWGHLGDRGWDHQGDRGWDHQWDREWGHQWDREWGHQWDRGWGHQWDRGRECHTVEWGPLTWLSPVFSKWEGLPLCHLTSYTTVAGWGFLPRSL